jgi:hypothetical protein
MNTFFCVANIPIRGDCGPHFSRIFRQFSAFFRIFPQKILGWPKKIYWKVFFWGTFSETSGHVDAKRSGQNVHSKCPLVIFQFSWEWAILSDLFFLLYFALVWDLQFLTPIPLTTVMPIFLSQI